MHLELSHILMRTVDVELPRLQAISESDAGTGTAGGWTRKQEIGHLIDSAANNHQRFVRASLEGEYQGPSYDQKGWVDLHGYQETSWSELVEFWRQYNVWLARVVARIPQDKMNSPCRVGTDEPVTLRFLITDYVAHMKHHLDHIVTG